MIIIGVFGVYVGLTTITRFFGRSRKSDLLQKLYPIEKTSRETVLLPKKPYPIEKTEELFEDKRVIAYLSEFGSLLEKFNVEKEDERGIWRIFDNIIEEGKKFASNRFRQTLAGNVDDLVEIAQSLIKDL